MLLNNYLNNPNRLLKRIRTKVKSFLTRTLVVLIWARRQM
jgi:hypothetical protein